jgi:hypothetical protein
MDYFQGVVTDYLRANRAVFVNTECYLSLQAGDAPPRGTSWYCDALAVNFREKTVYLCEITYSNTLHALMQRLRAWAVNWPALRAALGRDCAIPPEWPVRPWVFIPEALKPTYSRKLIAILDSASSPDGMPIPRLTYLEDVVPWKYRTWDRHCDSEVDVQQSGMPDPGRTESGSKEG